MPNLSGRYSSNLPTNYFNQIPEARGHFDVINATYYFQNLQRRMDGRPLIENNSDSDSDSYDVDDRIEMNFNDLTAPMKTSEISEKFRDYLIIQTSKSTVHLIDPGLSSSNANNHMHVLAVYIPAFHFVNINTSRLSLLNFLPEFSLCIVGNQFGKDVLFLRVVKSKNNHSVIGWDFSFFLEMSIVLDGDILGMTVTNDDAKGKIYILTDTLSFYIFNITKNSFEKLLNIKI